MTASAQTRERPALPGRPFAERSSNAPDTDDGTSEVTQLRDPQRIAGSAIARYGTPLAVSIACEIISTADYIEHGPAAGKPIPEPFIEQGKRGIALCRSMLAQVADRMTPQPAPRVPPPGWPT